MRLFTQFNFHFKKKNRILEQLFWSNTKQICVSHSDCHSCCVCRPKFLYFFTLKIFCFSFTQFIFLLYVLWFYFSVLFVANILLFFSMFVVHQSESGFYFGLNFLYVSCALLRLMLHRTSSYFIIILFPL